MPLTLKQANTICEKALEHARAKNFAKLTVVVLDDAGNLKAMQREDGASMFRYDVEREPPSLFSKGRYVTDEPDCALHGAPRRRCLGSSVHRFLPRRPRGIAVGGQKSPSYPNWDLCSRGIWR